MPMMAMVFSFRIHGRAHRVLVVSRSAGEGRTHCQCSRNVEKDLELRTICCARKPLAGGENVRWERLWAQVRSRQDSRRLKDAWLTGRTGVLADSKRQS